jgi:hypothetical protein
VIHEVDESLKAFVKREALEGSGAEVVFDAPTKDWASRRNTPTVDVYLYDIREDVRARQSGTYDFRDENGKILEHHLPPRYFKLSYLVTVWTQRPEDEHRLLSLLLKAFLTHPVLPEDLLVGDTALLAMPVGLDIAKPPPDNRQISDVWSALGGELKPSLDLVVRAPMVVGSEPAAEPPVKPLVAGMHGDAGQSEEVGGGLPPGDIGRAAEQALADAEAAAAASGGGGIRRGRRATTP